MQLNHEVPATRQPGWCAGRRSDHEGLSDAERLGPGGTGELNDLSIIGEKLNLDRMLTVALG